MNGRITRPTVALLIALIAASAVLVVALTDDRQNTPPGREPNYAHNANRPVPSRDKPNILLIVIDALRKDHVSAYGYDRKTTPVIDGLAENGLLFEDAVSQSPWTAPSMASMFTSRYPTQTGVGVIENIFGKKVLSRDSTSGLDEDAVTLAEILFEDGYRTCCVATNVFVTDKFGMLQGFEIRSQGDGNAEKVVDVSIKHLDGIITGAHEGTPRPFFLYLHFMDAHVPVQPPPPYNVAFDTISSCHDDCRHSAWAFDKAEELGSERFRAYRRHKLARYDGAVRFVDAEIGRLVEYIIANGLLDNTLIVITADHGEEFWDHAGFEKEHLADPRGMYGVGHGHTMFRELLDVPLLMLGPGIPKGVHKGQVREIDIMPTILAAADVGAGMRDMEGIDLIAFTGRNASKDLVSLSEEVSFGYEMKALQDGRFKYVRCRDFSLLYDMDKDRPEKHDVSADHPGTVARMDAMMDGILEQMDGGKHRRIVQDEKTVQELKSLGYIQ